MSGACPVCGATNAPGARFCSTCGKKLEPAASARETRKTVTVLFADVTGSTALGEQLDPESLRALMTRYFAEMKGIIERHGGTVEKFIGDAVMAVFGIPVVHEDDALRAVRAAADIRDRLAELNADLTATRGLAIRFRTGLYTGEVVAGDPTTGQTLVTGDTVNTAARLEQAAPPGEILIGRPTYSLVRDAVEAEPVQAIAAKGKAEPVPAYRLVSVTPGLEGHARRLDRPLVGRASELARLIDAYRAAVRDRAPQLVTVLGTAGVGKSRLVSEFLSSVSEEAQILRGRCLPYGEGITYWAVREVVHARARITEGDSADEARVKVRTLIDGASDAEMVADRVNAAIGLEPAGAPQEEIFWAIRKLLEHLSRQRPLVAVVEDIHWAEPALLDLLEFVLDLATDAPLVIVCPARPELLERRPGWGGNRPSSAVLRLESLADDASAAVVEALPGGLAVPGKLRARILAAAEGNPLYLEEMIAMLVDEGHLVEHEGAWQATDDLDRLDVPPSVRALLAARIDALPEQERRVAERASVVGRVFDAGAVRELARDEPGDIGQSLLSLVRKELVRPERSDLTAGDAFKFRHLLIRDAAYEALPKAERAELHERFAEWLERIAGERAGEYQEILGYHLESAFRYRTELGESGERIDVLAARSGVCLHRAGQHALERGEPQAAADLYDRAWKLRNPAEPAEAALINEYVQALMDSGLFDRALEFVGEARQSIRDGHHDEAAVELELLELLITENTASEGWPDHAREVVSRLSVDALRQPRVRALWWRIHVELATFSGDLRSQAAAIRAEIASLEEAGRHRAAADGQAGLLFLLVIDDTPVSTAIEQCNDVLSLASASLVLRSAALRVRGYLFGLIGEFERGRQDLVEARRIARTLGRPRSESNIAFFAGLLELEARNYTDAEQQLRDGLAINERIGDRGLAAELAGWLGYALARQGRVDEAASFARQCMSDSPQEDVFYQSLARLVLSICAGADDRSTAIANAREAVRLVDMTTAPIVRALTHFDVAKVFLGLHLDADARSGAEQARQLARAKGATVLLEEAERFLAGLESSLSRRG